jgi:hypothetical protein
MSAATIPVAPVALALTSQERKYPRVRLWGFLYDEDGHVRVMRLIPTLVAFIILAFFGTTLIFVTPAVSDSTAIQVTWALFALAGLKLPIIMLLWHFISRNRDWPGRWAKWSTQESREILAQLEKEAWKAPHLPDTAARLDHLSREAWNVADAMEGDSKVDALTVALRIDEKRRSLARSSS